MSTATELIEVLLQKHCDEMPNMIKKARDTAALASTLER